LQTTFGAWKKLSVCCLDFQAERVQVWGVSGFDIMHTITIIDCILIVGFGCLVFIPFDKKRVRARWAKSVFVICAILGIAKGVVGLVWDTEWFVLGNEAGRRHFYLSGLLLGFLFSLILSGQLKGTEVEAKKSSNIEEKPN
jgi:hypothetical protein